MLTAAHIATIQSALDNLATYSPRALGCPIRPPVEFKTLAITTSVRWTRRPGNRWETPVYTAKCDLDCLYTYAEGHTRTTAVRNLFKRIAASAVWISRDLRVPLALSEPTKAKAQARAERRANADRAWQITLDRAVTAVEAEREAATTVIVAASHDAALDVKSEPTRIVCNNLAPRFVEAPIVPADAAPGSEGIFKALLGLRTEQKIVALVNALHAAGVTIHRLDEDGEPIIRAVLPNALGTCTVLNL
jgi:hypothetical protein